MTEGATLTGRALRDGRPVPCVEIGVSGVNREVSAYVGHFEIGTDPNGLFAFVNLPPDTDHYLYGIMDTMKSSGAMCEGARGVIAINDDGLASVPLPERGSSLSATLEK